LLKLGSTFESVGLGAATLERLKNFDVMTAPYSKRYLYNTIKRLLLH